MTKLPDAQFWRMWGVAFVAAAAFCAIAMNARPSHAELARASFYGSESGRRTANGARFNPLGLSAAHLSLPFGTRMRFTFRGRSAVCPITDRGPARWTGRTYDLSRGCARAIGLERVGVATVTVERLD